MVTVSQYAKPGDDDIKGFVTDTDHAVLVLAALGHKLRFELWRMLSSYGSLGLSAGHIAARLGVPPSSLSFHLQQMTRAGILMQRRSSRQMMYAVNSRIVDGLNLFLRQHSNGHVIRMPAAAQSPITLDDRLG